MPLASIDVGSNSVRLLVGEIRDGRVRPLMRGRSVTRLAAGMERTGRLSGAGMEATLGALRQYAEALRSRGASRVRAVGTSALREAGNTGQFLGRVLSETGTRVEVISGEEEARLTARGVLASTGMRGTALIIDIGGGSTEWILCKGAEVLRSGTVAVGVVKLLERHLHADPPSRDELSALEAEAEAVCRLVGSRLEGLLTNGAVLIGTAGTATTLASIDLALEAYDPEKVHEHEIPLGRLREIARRLIALPLDKRRGLRGLEPARADVIVPGAVLTVKCLEVMGFDNLVVSDQGLLEGVLLELWGEGPS
jgi:exopolyphosphatase/guanosine-5'-triphosphate,3'-diphosphate pyrophosphatase